MDEDVVSEAIAEEEEMQTWVFENPDVALSYVARSLDNEAQQMGHNQQSRHTRVLASKVWSLYFEIMGLDQYYLFDGRVDEPEEETNLG